jgi:hypothetical protein
VSLADLLSFGFIRPFSHVKNHGEGTAQITTQGHRGTPFSGRFQISGDRGTQLLRAAAPMSKKTLVGAAIRSREDHSDEKITHHEVGWSPLRNHPINVRGGQVSDWEESQMLAALAVSELPAALQ